MLILKYKKSNAFTSMNRTSEGFTLIELLVVISIIGILVGLSFFGLQGAREASRDARRKSDLEQIRSGLEIYKADCDSYPIGNGYAAGVLATTGTSLAGNGSSTSCAVSNVYIADIPLDPTDPNRGYRYYSADGVTYELCASMEQSNPGTLSCGSSSACGGASCNYKVKNP